MTVPPCEPKGQWPACFVAVLVLFALLLLLCGKSHARPVTACTGMEPVEMNTVDVVRRGLWHVPRPTCHIRLSAARRK